MDNNQPQSLLASASSGEVKPGPHISPEEREHHLKVARVFIFGWLEAYKDREITFKTYCRNIHRNLHALKLDGFERQKKLGFALEEALALGDIEDDRTSRSLRNNPRWLQKMCFELVQLASQDGLVKTKESTKPTAFSYVSDLLTSYGVAACSPERVIKLCAMWRRELKGR